MGAKQKNRSERKKYKVTLGGLCLFLLPVGMLNAFELPSENPYSLSPEELSQSVKAGAEHELVYPVSTTRVLIPNKPLRSLLDADSKNPLKKIIGGVSSGIFKIKDMRDLYNWLGVVPFNENNYGGIYQIPKPASFAKDQPIGATLLQTKYGEGLTFACSSCHAGRLLGRSVLGLPNKNVRANKMFVLAKNVLPLTSPLLFQIATQSSSKEREMYSRARKALNSVQADSPQVLGLDTSLSHIGRSLATRNEDEVASKSSYYETFPRAHQLDHFVADSKIGTWWLVKYKTRWLSDGSVLGGNPVLTNILWNEIGRGADLEELEQWIDKNPKTVRDLTNAVFATKAPKWTDYFLASSVNLQQAKRGEALFNNNCAHCHGVYEKEWSKSDATIADVKLLETSRVSYHKETPVINVGTDPQRREGIRELAGQLNRLRISKRNGMRVEEQDGYVPPPLVGVWARYPYFHNNSAPNLCAVLTVDSKRPKNFYQGPSEVAADFDQDCVGFPVGNKIPKHWKKSAENFYNTEKPGLSNSGHTFMLLNDDGSERYSSEDKQAIISYLKTL